MPEEVVFLWPKIRRIHLTQNMRVLMCNNESARIFSENLLSVGNGTFSGSSDSFKTTPTLCRVSNSLDTLISDVYEDIKNIHHKDLDYFSERAILAPLNRMTKVINQKVLNIFFGEEVKFLAKNTLINDDDGHVVQPETLATLNSSGVPEHEILLKIGVPIIIMRNLSPPTICNGTRAIVKSHYRNIIKATLLTGPGAGEDVLIPRIKTIPNDTLKFMRTQFPVQLCFAMTIDKAQGQTFKRVGVDLSSQCFSHGQLYVACSRVGNADDIFILSIMPYYRLALLG